MEIRINYTENTHIWRIEAIAEKHGYTQTADCYWTQIFKDENGNSIIATREKKS